MTDEWDEYEDGLTGRKFYFNPSTREKSWKPPRKSKGSSEGMNNDLSVQPLTRNKDVTVCFQFVILSQSVIHSSYPASVV